MTVSQLKKILEELETTGVGNYQGKFCAEAKSEPNANGTGAVVLPSRTFDFSDREYEFKVNSYMTNNCQYPCKTTIHTDNIEVTPLTETVTFHQF
jgi:hypothetical protein